MWARIEPLLPDRAPRRGGRWRDHRVVVEGICWRTGTGAPWRDLPAEFGPRQTAWHRFNAWAGDGTWDKVLIAIQGEQHAPTFNGNRDNLPEGTTVSWVRERTRGWQ